jgi:hypothetical protein
MTKCKDKAKSFVEMTKEALDLISKNDRKHFFRIKQEIKYIVPGYISGAAYDRYTRTCTVDFQRYKFDKNYNWYLYSYAGMLVHESTHGYLDSKGIGYTSKNRIRIERICHNEENRFYSKIEYSLKDRLMTKFDEKRWYYSWHSSILKKIQMVFNKYKESKKPNNPADVTLRLRRLQGG